MLALTEYEAGICDCGLHESIADAHKDPNVELVARKCPVCADRDRGIRMLHARDEAELKTAYSGKPPPPEAPLPDDGRHLSLKVTPPSVAPKDLDADPDQPAS